MHDNGTNGRPIGPRWRLQGVSVQGYSHLRDGVECQDAYRHTTVGAKGAQVLAVADGAGSRARSAEGAALAVGLATAHVAERLGANGVPATPGAWRRLLARAYDDVLASFSAAIERMGPDPKAFAATLTTVVVAPPWLGILNVGDGFVVARVAADDGGHDFHLVSYDQSPAEYVNETTFLTSAGAQGDARIDCVHDPGLTGVLLATDGLAPAAVRRSRGTARANRSFLEPLLDSLDDPAEIARLLLDDRISALSADDKTLLLAVAS